MNAEVKIRTKKLNDKWIVYSTICGYDFSFSSPDRGVSVGQMNDTLGRLNIKNAIWLPEEIVKTVPVNKRPSKGMCSVRIDKF